MGWEDSLERARDSKLENLNLILITWKMDRENQLPQIFSPIHHGIQSPSKCKMLNWYYFSLKKGVVVCSINYVTNIEYELH